MSASWAWPVERTDTDNYGSWTDLLKLETTECSAGSAKQLSEFWWFEPAIAVKCTVEISAAYAHS